MEFDFEKLDVYKVSMEFVEKVFDISIAFPQKYQFSVGEQIRRASLSVPNNIAEGTGRKGAKDRKRFYNIAFGSIRECIPVLRITFQQDIIDKGTHRSLREYCHRISSMLVKLINSVKE